MLDNIKVMLGITDTLEDDKLNIIIKNTTSRLLSMLPFDVLPIDLNYIVEEVSIKRYNRIGAEGMSNESVEGRSNTYLTNDFDEYLNVIERYQIIDEKKGSVTFY